MSHNAHRRTKLTVPELSRKWGIGASKILKWIRSGELRASNFATCRNGRPTYKIDVDDIAIFERARRVIPEGDETSRRKLRRHKPAAVKEFF